MNSDDPLATIARLYRYPVKSLAPQVLERATLDERGFAGDRGSALFIDSQTHARAGKTLRGKEHDLLHTVDSPGAAAALAAARGIVTDLRNAGPYFDASPISIVFDTWLRALEDIVYEPLDPLRFRPNIYALAEPSFRGSESALVGRLLTIGDVRLTCTAPIQRCVTITYDVATGVADPRIARAVATERENVMGVYCTVDRGGDISTGDTIRFS